jgi:flagellin
MRINHNIAALNTYRQLSANTVNSSKSLEKLSSGLRINRAGDDAAGLAISEKMRSQIRGLDTASRNANDGISLIQTAEGALNETHSILQRMKELAVQAANDTNTDADRAEIQKEIDQLTAEITRIAEQTEFNTKKLLDGSMATKVTVGTAGVEVSVPPGTPPAAGTYTVTVSKVDAQPEQPAQPAEGDIIAQTIDSDDTVTFDKNLVSVNVAAGKYKFTKTDSGWELTIGDEGSPAEFTGSLSDYGISNESEVTFATGDTFTVEITTAAQEAQEAQEASFSWTIEDENGNAVKPSTFDISFANPGSVSDGAEITITVDNTQASIFHIGANQGQNTMLSINKMDAESLGVNALDLTSQSSADEAITTIDEAISKVSSQRAALGAMQNRLEHTINNLGTAAENLTAAESRIRDVDMAKEMMEFTKNSILSQASQAMLAQANLQPQSVLQLLQ